MTHMDCSGFEEMLDRIVAGMSPVEGSRAATRHLHACARCRSLYAIVRGEPDAPPHDLGEETIQAILQNTAGTGCDETCERLCAWIDRELPGGDQEIISLHIDNCLRCRALATALAELKRELPDMAAIEPDSRFLEDALEAIRQVRVAPGKRRHHFRTCDWWYRIVCRPRFAWEAAYAGALILFLVLGSPFIRQVYVPRAITVERAVLHGSSQVIQKGAFILDAQQTAMQRSLDVLLVQSRGLASTAVGFRRSASATLGQKTTWLMQQINARWIEISGTGQAPDKLR